MNASYFNHKSFGEEMLIEKNSLEIVAEQINHSQALYNRIYSKEFFNLNISYGCMLSAYKVLQALIEDEVI